SRRDRRVVVWEEDEQGTDPLARGLERRERGPPRPDLRDQIDLHPAARSGVPDRRRAAAARDLHARNRRSVTGGMTPLAAARANSVSTARRPSVPRSIV